MLSDAIIPFFTRADLQQLTTFGNTTYDKSNKQHAQVRDYLRKNVWAKTEYWYNRVLSVNSDHVDPAFWDVDPPAKRAIRVRA